MPVAVMTMLLVVANVMGAGMIVPQVARLRRTGSTNGVSLPWIGVGIALNLWWLAYGVAAGIWGVVPVAVGAGLLYGAMAVIAVRIAGSRAAHGVVRGAVAATVPPSIGLAIGGWHLAGVVIGLSYGVQFAPAALEALRVERVDGIAPTTWIMAAVEAAIWLVYGLDVGDAALVVGGAGGLAMSALILARVAIGDRPRTAQPAARL